MFKNYKYHLIKLLILFLVVLAGLVMFYFTRGNRGNINNNSGERASVDMKIGATGGEVDIKNEPSNKKTYNLGESPKFRIEVR